MSFHRPPLIDHNKIYWDTYHMFGEQQMIYWHQTIPGMPPYRARPPPQARPPPYYDPHDSICTPTYDTREPMYDPEKTVEINNSILQFLDQVYKDSCKK